MISSLIEFLAGIVIDIISTLGYAGVFLAMAIESACIPLPSEVIMPFAGSVIADPASGIMQPFSNDIANLLLLSIIGALGNLAGSLLAYWAGARGGRPLVERYGKYVLLSHHDLDVADRWFSRYGRSTVFFTRMMPVIRTFISFPAGISRMNLTQFSIYTFLGALPWSFFLAYVGFKMGENWESLRDYFHKADILIGILIVAGLAWYIWRHVNNMKKDRIAAMEPDADSTGSKSDDVAAQE